jgi:hypothetical protein
MSEPTLPPITRNRRIVLTLGAGVLTLVTAIFLVGAPPIPATAGVALAAGWLIWRTPPR